MSVEEHLVEFLYVEACVYIANLFNLFLFFVILALFLVVLTAVQNPLQHFPGCFCQFFHLLFLSGPRHTAKHVSRHHAHVRRVGQELREDVPERGHTLFFRFISFPFPVSWRVLIFGATNKCFHESFVLCNVDRSKIVFFTCDPYVPRNNRTCKVRLEVHRSFFSRLNVFVFKWLAIRYTWPILNVSPKFHNTLIIADCEEQPVRGFQLLVVWQHFCFRWFALLRYLIFGCMNDTVNA